MTGKVELPLNLGETASEYLEELKRNLEKAQDYATAHTEKAQQRYVSRYNLRAREKSFEIGQKVLVLIQDSTSSKPSRDGWDQLSLKTNCQTTLIW